MKYGIDVSENNGVIDWDSVAPQIDFAILRVAWLGNHNNHTEDSQYRRNYNECKRLGIPIGGYVYSYCESEEALISGAKKTLEILADDEFDLQLYLDLEDVQISGIDSETQTDNSIAFCRYIKENSDLDSGIYANLNWFENFLNLDKLIEENLPLWIAHWYVNTDEYQNSPYEILQYSNISHVDGINGFVDMNVLYKDEWIESDEIISSDDINISYQYYNDGLIEKVYSDTECNNQIGFLNPWEICPCLGQIDNRAIVLYNIDNQNNKKIGFVKRLGGIK